MEQETWRREPRELRWLTLKGVKEMSGLDEGTAQGLIRAGELDAMEVDGALLVSEESLERYLLKHKIPYQPRLF